jgi:transglutaminase-like putative cysteine protease
MDYDHPKVADYVRRHSDPSKSKKENVVRLFYQIRDEFHYYPYDIDLRPFALKASYVIGKPTSYCAQKAMLLGACARAVGVPSQLQFFNVRNHLGMGNLQKFTKIDLLVFHTGLQVQIDGKWLKVTPAFDAVLCKKLGVAPLEFDGEHDAIFQEYEGTENDKKGFMEYVHDYGVFAEVPMGLMMQELSKYYPHIFSQPPRETEETQFFSNWDVSYLKKQRDP